MTEIPALWVNIGILVLTGVMALVAFVQARAALKDAGRAEDARDKAVAAQEASAKALEAANEIARQARDALDERVDIERVRDAQANERVDVSWQLTWPEDIAPDSPIAFAIRNAGTTDAHDVELILELPQGRQLFKLGTIHAGEDRRAPIQRTEMRGSAANLTMRSLHIPKHIHWKSPLGRASETDAVHIWVTDEDLGR